ncbi:winged helix-turn-helix transcriptional regulator [Flexibacterium corallicola]|uniref:winged helix-turn-helix transcriptional regulator n=1 Tax=Flexibacterium corallicola TaxID=3037259 RepID=UPI00286ED00D|nr:helix-turn-helix domain-containing protein [Pseudovibrio sp. M1P-2-3]
MNDDQCTSYFSAACPGREVFDQLADKWSMMVLTTLNPGPMRFNEVRRQLEGITQKALTQCLRRLERNGLVTRHVITTSPIAVEYTITPLGSSLQKPFYALHLWFLENMPEIERAQQGYDERKADGQ